MHGLMASTTGLWTVTLPLEYARCANTEQRYAVRNVTSRYMCIALSHFISTNPVRRIFYVRFIQVPFCDLEIPELLIMFFNIRALVSCE